MVVHAEPGNNLCKAVNLSIESIYINYSVILEMRAENVEFILVLTFFFCHRQDNIIVHMFNLIQKQMLKINYIYLVLKHSNYKY